ncbi:MAG: hypothetical protein ACRCUE_03130 [Bosea sp. (in: a-proteobacteria)]
MEQLSSLIRVETLEGKIATGLCGYIVLVCTFLFSVIIGLVPVNSVQRSAHIHIEMAAMRAAMTLV